VAKEHSFDVSSEIDKQEFKNALEQTKKEIGNRFDFKGVTAEVDYNDKAKSLTLICSSDSKVDALIDILQSKMLKRGVDIKALEEIKREGASSGNVRVYYALRDVLSSENAKKIVKEIKASKIKVTAAIRGEEVRVSGKSIDDLRTVMRLLKEKEFDFPMGFINLK
jgi:uncharacterized protein YajQ (UPF0234 family)